MKDTLLLVVDVQNAMFKLPPYNEKTVISNIKHLIDFCRTNGIETVYVRHDDGIGSDLERETDDWQIYHEIAPINGEMIFDKKFNSAFVKTGLNEYLQQKEIKHLMIVGLQTEYCIDATIKSAFEHGFKVIIPEETNTTFNNEYLTAELTYIYFNFKIWNGRFAKVLPIDELKKFYKKEQVDVKRQV